MKTAMMKTLTLLTTRIRILFPEVLHVFGVNCRRQLLRRHQHHRRPRQVNAVLTSLQPARGSMTKKEEENSLREWIE